MKFRQKNEGSAPKISPLLRSIILSGVLLSVAVIGLNVWTLREDWNETVDKAEDTAVNLSLSQARQADDTFCRPSSLCARCNASSKSRLPQPV